MPLAVHRRARRPRSATRCWRWLTAARENRGRLLALLDAIHIHPLPEPVGAFDSLVEFDRRRVLKEQLQQTVIGTCLETELAIGALEGALHGEGREAAGQRGGHAVFRPVGTAGDPPGARNPARNPEAVRGILPSFLRVFREEPLLFTPISEGGDPRRICALDWPSRWCAPWRRSCRGSA